MVPNVLRNTRLRCFKLVDDNLTYLVEIRSVLTEIHSNVYVWSTNRKYLHLNSFLRTEIFIVDRSIEACQRSAKARMRSKFPVLTQYLSVFACALFKERRTS